MSESGHQLRGVDLTGKTFSYLKVMRPVYVPSRGRYLWECQCVCGKRVRKPGTKLKTKGVTISCGCKRPYRPKTVDITGQVFGKLTALRPAGHDRWGVRTWTCLCECGREHIASGSKLRTGKIASCGCASLIPAENRHGMGGTLTHRVWLRMRAKKDYDPRWADYREFLADMGEKRPREYLVRLDETKPYSMENCEWREHRKGK